MIERRRKRVSLAGLWVVGILGAAAPHATAAPAGPERTPAGRHVWALIAGVERYRDGADFPICRGAARDALLMARWMIEEAGWPSDHVVLLADPPSEPVPFRDPARQPKPRDPTKAALDDGVSWLARVSAPGDIVVIYFAGQAVSLPRRPDDRPLQPARDYVIPRDAAPNLEASGWRLGDAIGALARSGNVSVVCLLDTSPLGRLRRPRVEGLPEQPAPELGRRMLEGIARWPGVTAWMAATERPAGETAAGHGHFTAALVDAFGTEAHALNLHACLHRLRRNPALAEQGFKTVGDFAPDLSLWPGHVRVEVPRAEPMLQRGHADRVTATAFRGDGGRMITASMDSTVRIWRTSDALLLHVLPWTTNGYHSLALGGDGRLLVAGGGRGDVLFFDMPNEVRRPHDQQAHTYPVTGVAVLADGRRAVSLDASPGRCVLWDTSTGTVRHVATPLDAGGLRLAAASQPGGAAFAVAARETDGREAVHLYAIDGKSLTAFTLPAPEDGKAGGRADPITALRLSDRGDRVVVGTRSGRLVDCDTHGARNRPDHRLSGPVDHLELGPAWDLAGAGSSAQVVAAGAGPFAELKLDQPIQQLVVSADGRLAATCGQQGQVRAWNVAADGRAATLIDLGGKIAGDGLSLALSPGGDLLAAGDGNGQIRTWRLPQGEARPPVAGSTGRLGHLAVSPDGGRLLQVTWDNRPHSAGKAIVWRFGAERGARAVPGSFLQAGAFLRDGTLVLIDDEGRLVAHDGVSLERLRPFEHPRAPRGRGELGYMFTTLAVSRDGQRVAAGSDDGPLACVWTAADGRLLRTFRTEGDKVRAVSLSADGGSLATTGDDGVTRVHDVNRPENEPPLHALGRLETAIPGAPGAATAVAVSPVDPRLLAIGRRDGTLELRPPEPAKPRALGPIGGEVKAVAFSPDGSYLAAAGDGPFIMLVRTAAPGRPIVLETNAQRGTRGPHHSEKITGLAFWPDGKRLASASLDSTVRLWSLERGALLGTLTSSDDAVEWVVFTPDGCFEGSAEGERRVTWRLQPDWWPGEGDGLIAQLDQLGERFRAFDLANDLTQGKAPQMPRPEQLAAPPRLVLERVAALGPGPRAMVVRIRSSDARIEHLRLYHNGVPLDLEGTLDRAGLEHEVTVKLVHQKNELYAMASGAPDQWGRDRSVDALSNRIDVDCTEETPGRIHLIALGVSEYKAQALRFADRDAESVAAFLRQKGLQGAAVAEPVVLTNKEVTLAAVNQAFDRVRRAVKGRPEDTVVVFLAGHAALRRGQFCLMLHDAELPARPFAAEEVALRAPSNLPAPALPPLSDPTVLPYDTVHFKLSFLDALRRLVIVDACEAEALFDNVAARDAARRVFERQTEAQSRRVRTSYILATRRGERAAEPPQLEHGLLTYALLRGLGDPTLRQQVDLAVFREHPTADFDGDGWVTANELQRYAKQTMPALAERFQGPGRGLGTEGVRRSGPATLASVASQYEGTGTFRLVEAPGRSEPQPAP